MTTLYIDRADCDLDVEAETIVLRSGEDRRSTVPLRLVERVVVGRAARLTSRALARLVRAGVGLLIEPEPGRGEPAVIAPAPGDRMLRIAQYHLSLDRAARAKIAAGLVRRRLEGARLGLPAPSSAAGLRVIATLGSLGGAVSIERLRGLEGAATAAIFEAFAQRVPPPFVFAGRNRRPPRDPVNALLSLGYTLAQFESVRMATLAGLDPAIGIYHETSRNRDSLACDLVEPVRPLVEDWVVAMLGSGEIGIGDFSTSEAQGCRMLKGARRKVYAHFEETAREPVRACLAEVVGEIVAVLRRRAADAASLAGLLDAEGDGAGGEQAGSERAGGEEAEP